MGQVSLCPKCGSQFTARETVDRLGTTVTVQPEGAAEGPWSGGLSRAGNHRLIVLAVEQRVRSIGITMRPAIYRDGRNVAIAGEAAASEHSV